MSLTTHDIVAAGLEILDNYGLEDLSMRRLAQLLDVKASALYWHVANKQTLLAAMADAQGVSSAAHAPTPAVLGPAPHHRP